MGADHISAGDDAVVEDFLVAVDVGKEAVDRFKALDQALLQLLPFARADQPRQGVEGQDPLTALLTGAIEAKGGTQALEQHAGGRVVAVDLFDAQLPQGGEQGP